MFITPPFRSFFLFIFNNHFRYALILLKTKGKIIQRHFLYSYLFCSFRLRFFLFLLVSCMSHSVAFLVFFFFFFFNEVSS